MVDGFVKSRQLERARQVFDEMPVRDALSWGTMIVGYSHSKLCGEAIQLFNEMISLGVKLDNIALVSVLSACAQMGELEQGSMVHDYIMRNGIRIDTFLANCMVWWTCMQSVGVLRLQGTYLNQAPDKVIDLAYGWWEKRRPKTKKR